MRADRTLVLLRGINVGGRHPVPMPRLRVIFAELGCDHIDTYLQTGNVVCAAHPSLTADAISSELAKHFDFPIPATLRTAKQLGEAIQANPFSQPESESLHVVFLEAPLPAAALKMLEAKPLGKERLAAVGREIFLYLPHGFGRSRLALASTAAGVPGYPTVRNWKTVLELQRMLAG